MSAELSPGRMVAGRYRLGALLGVGGAGVVYEARDTAHDTVVAIKLLTRSGTHPGAYPGAGDEARFAREVRAGEVIGHRGIAAVIGSGHHGAVPFIVMERLHGEDLRSQLEQHGPLSVSDAVGLTCQLCEVIEAAHSAGVVHRDLKPANLFLMQGPGGPLKVLDFGVAKWMHATLELTGPSQTIGTPAFMAPELLLSSKHAAPSADIYAIGACLFSMLTARPPFVANSEVELVLMAAHDPPPSVRAERPDVPAALDGVLQRALAKQPQGRPPSAGALGAALRWAM